MSYKAIFVADLHISNKLPFAKVVENGETDRLRDQLAIFDEIYEVAVKEKVEDIFVIGDLFDRSLVDAVTLTKTVEAVSKTPVTMRIIAGNHDAASAKGERFTVEALGAMKHDKVRLLHGEYQPQKWLKFVAIPFMPVDATREAIKEYSFFNDNMTSVLLFHNSVLGCDHLEWTCDDGLDPEELFQNFHYAIGGHFHHHQVFGPEGRGMYCGAPMHHHFGDVGREAGFWVCNFTKKGLMEKTFVETSAPKFYTTKDMKVSKYWCAGDYIRVEVECTNADWVNLEPKVKKFCDSLPKLNMSYKQKPIHNFKMRFTDQGSKDGKIKLSILNYIDNYVDSGDIEIGALDATKLKKIGRGIFEKVRSERGIM